MHHYMINLFRYRLADAKTMLSAINVPTDFVSPLCLCNDLEVRNNLLKIKTY